MVDGTDGIIHLAAIVGFPACAKQPALSVAVNISGTENLLRFRNRNTPFVFASTGSVYGKVEGVCNEDSPLNAVSLYGENKRAAEEMVRGSQTRFPTGLLRGLVLVPACVLIFLSMILSTKQ